ncbi:MAG: PEP/pyruvate-binding domain-containing protein [Anaerolineae bacterium]
MEQTLILPFHTDDATLDNAGGKGLNLAKLARAGFPVPPGFIITTHAYRTFVDANKLQPSILQLAGDARPDDPTSLEDTSQAIRHLFQQGSIPQPLADAVRTTYHALPQFTIDNSIAIHQSYNELSKSEIPNLKSEIAIAVRSSATAEDLPGLSFAGQQDTFLNVIGDEALLEAVVNCWSSLWTARAMGYRARNGISHAEVALAVVVQEMVQSESSGVLFTANPLTGKRTETVIDATLGLGEALVAGHVEPDHYVIDTLTGRITGKTLGAKALSIRGQAGGGTITIDEDASEQQALPNAVIVELTQMAQQVADLYETPQDMEWAWADRRLFLLQSRPITSLYPIPEGMDPEPLKVMFSFGAVQGILGPMTPLGQDAIRGLAAGAGGIFGYHLTPATQRIVFEAGERLFLNFAPLLRHGIGRRLTRAFLGVIEPGTAQAVDELWDDPRLAVTTGRLSPDALMRIGRVLAPLVGRFILCLLRPDAERVRFQSWLEELLADFEARSAAAMTLAARVALLEDVLDTMFLVLLPAFVPRMAGGMATLNLLNHLASDLPDGRSMVLEITRGLPHNVTTEMDLALWDTARAIKADPTSADRFEATDAATLASSYLASQLPATTQTAIAGFLQRYGMRGVGEIDLGRRRWREDPTQIMQVLQSYLRIENAEQAPDATFKRGAASAEAAINRLAKAVRRTHRGRLKARLVKFAARRMRALAGLRESPKFFAIRQMGIVRNGLLESGRELVAQGILAQPEDIFFLHLPELKALAAISFAEGLPTEAMQSFAEGLPTEAQRARSGDLRPSQDPGSLQTHDWQALIAERRQTYQREELRRQVPRLLLSDGQAFYEGISAPAGSGDGDMTGSPVSPGVAEGVVNVVLDPHTAQLAPGEILVCHGTDPAWTPLFLAAGGLVMEVGGLMTHGAVVAREYGIPAVVGVDQATTRLRTGQRVRVDGSDGQIVILGPAE